MRILVTGATGQIGSYACELLLAAGHTVLGIGSPHGTHALPEGVLRAAGAWTDDGLSALLEENGALDAIVHLGAPTDIPASWNDPEGTFRTIGELTAKLAYRIAKAHPSIRLVHGSSSNVFGRAAQPVLDESTPIAPVSPYGVAKAAAHMAVTQARTSFGARASNLIFFQALSKRARGSLVLRKITRQVAAVVRGEATKVTLGTMSVVRDVSHAQDFARAAVLLATGAPDLAGDYACASGIGRSIREMAEVVCGLAGIDAKSVLVEDPTYARPGDIPRLVGDARRLRAVGWAPQVSFEALARECLEADDAASR